jgi:hypothetical protein
MTACVEGFGCRPATAARHTPVGGVRAISAASEMTTGGYPSRRLPGIPARARRPPRRRMAGRPCGPMRSLAFRTPSFLAVLAFCDDDLGRALDEHGGIQSGHVHPGFDDGGDTLVGDDVGRRLARLREARSIRRGPVSSCPFGIRAVHARIVTGDAVSKRSGLTIKRKKPSPAHWDDAWRGLPTDGTRMTSSGLE